MCQVCRLKLISLTFTKPSNPPDLYLKIPVLRCPKKERKQKTKQKTKKKKIIMEASSWYAIQYFQSLLSGSQDRMQDFGEVGKSLSLQPSNSLHFWSVCSWFQRNRNKKVPKFSAQQKIIINASIFSVLWVCSANLCEKDWLFFSVFWASTISAKREVLCQRWRGVGIRRWIKSCMSGKLESRSDTLLFSLEV